MKLNIQLTFSLGIVKLIELVPWEMSMLKQILSKCLHSDSTEYINLIIFVKIKARNVKI